MLARQVLEAGGEHSLRLDKHGKVEAERRAMIDPGVKVLNSLLQADNPNIQRQGGAEFPPLGRHSILLNPAYPPFRLLIHEFLLTQAFSHPPQIHPNFTQYHIVGLAFLHQAEVHRIIMRYWEPLLHLFHVQALRQHAFQPFYSPYFLPPHYSHFL